jgi:hypothetical protein
MHESSTPGKLEGTYLNFARMCRCTEEEIKAAILELQETKTATVIVTRNAASQKSNAKVTVINRRMFNAFKAKQDAAHRQARFRARKKSNAESNADVTPYSSSSSSSSSSKRGEPHFPLLNKSGNEFKSIQQLRHEAVVRANEAEGQAWLAKMEKERALREAANKGEVIVCGR